MNRAFDKLGQTLIPQRHTSSIQLTEKLNELGNYFKRTRKVSIDEIAGMGAVHPSPWVRHYILKHLSKKYPSHPTTRELVRWLTHDYEDFIAFDAIDLCGALSVDESLADLMIIVGTVSERLHGSAGKPVGIGHAVVIRAITRIVNSRDPKHIENLEARLFPEGKMPSNQSEPTHGQERRLHSKLPHSHERMCYVERGPVELGIPAAFGETGLLFEWDKDPVGTVECPSFFIDVTPVTVAEYDAFASSDRAWDHKFCHPAEPPGKIHLRNTLLDSRSGSLHPVTGIDWFDAYAYAASVGKRLPTEFEWQRAALGGTLRAYPWGDVFDKDRTQCLPYPEGDNWEVIESWRAKLLAWWDDPPSMTTCPVGIPGSQSPFGAMDMSGNVWEWTSSAYLGGNLQPGHGNRDAVDIIYDPSSYAVIKGGAWTSIPELVSPAFRGKDLLLDRHFENGFRCVCDCSPEIL